MAAPRRILLPMLALIALGIAVHGWILVQRKDAATARATATAQKTWRETRTAHYLIVSNAPQDQVALTGTAVEQLHVAWSQVFADMPRTHAPLRLVLYRTRAEFKANNRRRALGRGDLPHARMPRVRRRWTEPRALDGA